MSLALPDPSKAGVPLVPGYRLLERIGQGGSAVVYRAEADDDLARPFAVKLFLPDDRGAPAPEYARELETLRAIDAVRRAAGSRDIVEVVGAGEVDGYGYVVMEYVRGGTLEERLRVNGPLPAEEAVALVRPVLRALALLHGEGLLHKDVKPGNVLVGDDGHPRLGDFGLARSFDAPVSSAGTPGFCAPELYAGQAIAGGPQVDVYSAAATLYYLLTGQAPLPGRPDLFTLERHQVDRGLQAILFDALAADPRARTASAEALEEALAAWAAGDRAPAASGGRRSARVALAVGVAAALLAVGLVALAPWVARSSPPPLWDGATLQVRGPRVAWSDDGAVRLGDGAPVQALAARPVALGFDPGGERVAAIGPWGETVAVGLAGSGPQVLLRLGARSGEGDPPLCAVAISGRYLVRSIAGGPDGDRLELYDLRAGSVVARRDDVPAASALAVDDRPGAAGPTVYAGTPDGRLLVLAGPGLDRRRELRTHADEVLALAIDVAARRLLVVGDDRSLAPAAELGPGDVVLAGRDVGLARARRRVLKAYALPLVAQAAPVATRAAVAGLPRGALGAS